MTKRIIFLNGPAGSGKDTMGLAIQKALVFRKSAIIKFAEPIKRQLAELLNLTKVEEDFYFETQEGKRYRTERFNSMTPRQALITHSEDFAKKVGGHGVFGRYASAIIEKLFEKDFDTIIVTDSGFVTEAAEVLNHFGNKVEYLLVRLHRNGCSFDNDSRNYLNAPMFKNQIDVHNNGTIGDALKEIMKEIKFDAEPTKETI